MKQRIVFLSLLVAMTLSVKAQNTEVTDFEREEAEFIAQDLSDSEAVAAEM